MKRMGTKPMSFMIVPSASRVNLYDRVEVIPLDKITGFFDQHLATQWTWRRASARRKRSSVTGWDPGGEAPMAHAL
ncbi:hypothetical protein ShzoTeo12_41480 (plasmid) [Shinella zoogloeoides]|nr:hypothetical protein ShzoTeo12_41480 [Shinella zoogloeoides]